MPALSTLAFNALREAYLARDGARHAQLLAAHVRAERPAMTAIQALDDTGRWAAFAQASLRAYFEARQGRVYLARNSAHPTYVKVGKTRLMPEARMAALNTEGVVGQTDCLAALEVHDRHHCETAAHRLLSRYPRHKEFFEAPVPEVERLCRQAFEVDLLHFFEQGLEGVLPACTAETLAGFRPVR